MRGASFTITLLRTRAQGLGTLSVSATLCSTSVRFSGLQRQRSGGKKNGTKPLGSGYQGEEVERGRPEYRNAFGASWTWLMPSGTGKHGRLRGDMREEVGIFIIKSSKRLKVLVDFHEQSFN